MAKSNVVCSQPSINASVCPDNTDDCVFTPGLNGQGVCAVSTQMSCTEALLADSNGTLCLANKCTFIPGNETHGICYATSVSNSPVIKTCNDGSKLDGSLVCDGVNDCSDGEDEICSFKCGDPPCSAGCTTEKQNDNICNPECFTAQCNYDNGGCEQCTSGCYVWLLGDGICNPECISPACGFDNGDCSSDISTLPDPDVCTNASQQVCIACAFATEALRLAISDEHPVACSLGDQCAWSNITASCTGVSDVTWAQTCRGYGRN